MIQFLDRIERREIDHRRSDRHRAIISADIMRHIGQEQANPVAFANSQILKPLGHADHASGDFAIAIFAAHEIEQIGVAAPTSRSEEHSGHRQGRVKLVPLSGMVVARFPDRGLVRIGFSH